MEAERACETSERGRKEVLGRRQCIGAHANITYTRQFQIQMLMNWPYEC